MVQHEDHIFSPIYSLLICSTTTKLYPLSQLTPIKKDKIKKRKRKMKHRNDFQRVTWMVKKGIESNMLGKKKKETGQIDIYIYIHIYIYIYIYLMSNEKCAWFDCIAQRDPVFTYSILKDGQNKCLVVTPNFKTMYQHVILLKEFSKMLLF